MKRERVVEQLGKMNKQHVESIALENDRHARTIKEIDALMSKFKLTLLDVVEPEDLLWLRGELVMWGVPFAEIQKEIDALPAETKENDG